MFLYLAVPLSNHKIGVFAFYIVIETAAVLSLNFYYGTESYTSIDLRVPVS
jgi:hypothetical protein